MLPQGGSLVCYSDSDSSSSTSSSDIEVIDASSELSEESDEESTDETKPFNVKDAVNGIIDKLISKALKQASLRKRFQRFRSAGNELTEDEDTSDSLDSSSTSSTSSSSEEEDESCDQAKRKEFIKRKAPKTKGEIRVCELPPIQDLQISVPEHECLALGSISSIVDDLVVVKAHPLTPAVDLDSCLFLEGGKRPLGQVFDVFGPVGQPYYSVRFNSQSDIKEREVKVGDTVFFAPRTEYTNFVFFDQLRKLKGSDASWRHDQEPPRYALEYSDDEQERVAKRNSHCKNRYGTHPAGHNPFYRRSRRYDPKESGPIQWNSGHVPSPATGMPPFPHFRQ